MSPVRKSAFARTALLCLSSIPSITFAVDPDTKTMSPIVVSSDPESEQAVYRVGGDVQVITREQIETRHFTSVKEAIKRIPGVQISSPGYRAYEYGSTFGEEISINGDSSVLITVDGRRLDNDASSYGQSNASKSRLPLDVITNINNVERIEVIKGTGAVAYGADAAGGVINIVTRSGRDRHELAVDASLGSWGQENYGLSQSGPIGDETFRYFISGSYQTGDNTKYKDADTDRTAKFINTGYREQGASIRLDKDFGSDQTVSLSYSWTDNKAHYPITAPDADTLHLFLESRLSTSSSTPGYRNWFLYDAWLGSFSLSRSSDVDLKYTFDRDDDGLTSYVRAYRNHRKYHTRVYGGLFGTPLADVTPALIENAHRSAGRHNYEIVDGADLQLAKRFGRHSLISGWEYRTSEFERIQVSNGSTNRVERDSYQGYLQDKIALTERFTVSPGVRYDHFGKIDRISATGVTTTKPSMDKVTFAVHSNYTFDLLGDFFMSWSQIYRPLTNNDFTNESPVEPLKVETGDAFSAGIRKNFGSATFLSVNFAFTDMDNAVGRYSVWDPTVVNAGSPTGFGNWVTRSVNATRKKESLNIVVDHRFSSQWAAAASYAYVKDRFSAKNYDNNPNDSNVNALINRFRPMNTYQADIMYDNEKWSAALTAQLFTGMSTRYFTDDRFTVLGFVANYDVLASTRLYVTVDNLTNEAYENRGHPVYGPGSYPQPGRSFVAGINQRF
ncbi:TonB-dependent receptor [Steroidobacter cummioxidans]|uniref:TonB-dependent receptor n=1 Tax=Steroidobacter cummioxidans TaxID=1803913 RepID=UPI000E318901|nr:TonB-dependent receptor [Steroidobacter cummioxidans]